MIFLQTITLLHFGLTKNIQHLFNQISTFCLYLKFEKWNSLRTHPLCKIATRKIHYSILIFCWHVNDRRMLTIAKKYTLQHSKARLEACFQFMQMFISYIVDSDICQAPETLKFILLIKGAGYVCSLSYVLSKLVGCTLLFWL